VPEARLLPEGTNLFWRSGGAGAQHAGNTSRLAAEASFLRADVDQDDNLSEGVTAVNEPQLMHAFVENFEVNLLYEGEDKPCYLRIALPAFGIVNIDDVFPNPRMASATLACTLTYGPACEFLHLHDVPSSSRLWDLNHSGYSLPSSDGYKWARKIDTVVSSASASVAR
jgi:hypothetical protein